MHWTAAESYVPPTSVDIEADLARHLNDGWNFVGVAALHGDESVILQYRPGRGSQRSPIDERAVAAAVSAHLRDRYHLKVS